MNWAVWLVFGIAAVVLIGSAAIAGGSARFWFDLAGIAWSHALPALKAQIAKDMTSPEVDARTKANAKLPGGQVPKGTGVTTGKTITQSARVR